jgi:MFS family permease
MSVEVDAVYDRATRRLLPFLFICYVANHIDRANVAFLKTVLGAIGLDDAAYATAVGAFYLGYAAFEVPSNLILARVGARRWIARIMISWGVIAAAGALVSTTTQFAWLRFLLGAAEAGFYPGIILYLTTWFPPERRARATAQFLTSIPLASVISGPLTGALLGLDGVRGIEGWRWVLALEGLPPVLLGLAVWRWLPDGPRDARWLGEAERGAVLADLARHPAEDHSFWRGLRDARLWLLCGLYFLLVIGLYGVTYWTPPIVRAQPLLTGASEIVIGCAVAVPFAAAAIAMVLWARSSDRRIERRGHVAGAAALAAVALIIAGIAPGQQALLLVALTLACMGVYATLGPFWGLATAVTRGRAAAGGLALINSAGALGGYAGPKLFQALGTWKGPVHAGYLALALAVALLALLVPIVRTRDRG